MNISILNIYAKRKRKPGIQFITSFYCIQVWMILGMSGKIHFEFDSIFWLLHYYYYNDFIFSIYIFQCLLTRVYSVEI